MTRAYDLSPLYRSMIGVDHVSDLIEAAMRSEGDADYPPYDIEKTGEDTYRIALAAPGLKPDELEVVVQPNLLVVSGRKPEPQGARSYLHRGILAQGFSRRFELADHVVVKSAEHADGVLTIDLAREVPEALKPRRIEINAAAGPSRLEEGRTERRAA